jgi:hypothetical protein
MPLDQLQTGSTADPEPVPGHLVEPDPGDAVVTAGADVGRRKLAPLLAPLRQRLSAGLVVVGVHIQAEHLPLAAVWVDAFRHPDRDHAMAVLLDPPPELGAFEVDAVVARHPARGRALAVVRDRDRWPALGLVDGGRYGEWVWRVNVG